MIFLKIILSFLTIHAYANYSILDMKINCTNIEYCFRYKENLKSLPRSYNTRSDFFEKLGMSLRSFRDARSYVSEKDGVVNIDMSPKLLISKVEIRGADEFDLSDIVTISPGDDYEPDFIPQFREKALLYIKSRGYEKVDVDTSIDIIDGKVEIIFNVNASGAIRIKNVSHNLSEIGTLKELTERYLARFKGKVWVPAEFEKDLLELSSSYKKEGHILALVSLDQSKTKIDGNSATPFVSIRLGQKFAFNIVGNSEVSDKKIKEKLRATVTEFNGDISTNGIKKIIEELYKEYGIYDCQFDVSKYYDKSVNQNIYSILIKEGKTLFLRDVKFSGMSFFNDSSLNEYYYSYASPVANRGGYDEKYSERFSDILKELYYKHGFLFSKISEHRVFKNKDGSVDIEYRILEGSQLKWKEFRFKGLEDETYTIAIENLVNQVSGPVNVNKVKEDIARVLNNLKDKGYYNAQILNLSSDDVVTYDNQYKNAFLNLDIELGEKKVIENVIFQGHERSNPIVFSRAVKNYQGYNLTPTVVSEIEDSISSLGLFSSINIEVHDIPENPNRVNLIVFVKERDYGFIDIAPGFRSDIGLKVSTSYGRQNLWGMNRSITLKGQMNQRLDYSALDSRRREEEKKLLEFGLSTKYTEPYLFNFPLAFSSIVSYTRKRFRSFDADISKINLTLSKSITNYFTMSLRYQLEQIEQFDATDDVDKGNFSVGSLTPSFTLDFRDRPITPTKGAVFNLATEFAKPEFGSRDGDTEINYLKITSRNAFYSPFKHGVFAFSLAGGVQINQTTENFIPRIKVFRLTGLDRVRGFDDGEINRIESGEDVDDTFITDRVYFMSAKFEPRFIISDNFMFGPFIDAGRIFKDHFVPLSLRTSAGLSFKIITPVGTIDFDYGLKIQRKRTQAGGLESPGEFHISIGFF